MEIAAPALSRRHYTPFQRCQAVHYVSTLVCAVGIQRIFHSVEPAVVFLVGSWGTSIIIAGYFLIRRFG